MASDNIAAETLKLGIDILAEYLSKHSFCPSIIETNAGSGGTSAVGEFRRGDRRLLLHFRYSLGLVTYIVGDSAVSHGEYMKVLGANECKYPGFSDDPLDGFRDLLMDLQRYGEDFLVGTATAHRQAALKESEQNAAKVARNLIDYSGDRRLRLEARTKFRERDYKGVCELFSMLANPDDLTEAEIKFLHYSQKRI